MMKTKQNVIVTKACLSLNAWVAQRALDDSQIW